MKNDRIHADALLRMAKARISAARSGLKFERYSKWHAKFILLEDLESANVLMVWFKSSFAQPCEVCGCPLHSWCGAKSLTK